MAADSSMGFHHQGITAAAAAASVYSSHHHMLSFQSSNDAVSMGGGGAAGMGFAAPRNMSGTSTTAGVYLSPNNTNNTGTFGSAPVVGPSSRSSSSSGGSTTASKYKFVTGSPSEWSDRELSILKEGLVRFIRIERTARGVWPNRSGEGFQLAPGMAADSSMGFHHQGITAAAASVYSSHHHMLSFQSSSDAVSMGGGGAAGMGFAAPRSMSGTSTTAGVYLSPNNNNTGTFGNASVVGPSSRSSSSSGGSTTASKYKFVTGSPSEWSDRELSVLKEGLVRYAREPKIMRYIKIAAMLPNRTIRDVALRCWWSTGKDRKKKPDGFSTGKKIRDMKDQMVASAPMANFHMAPTNNLTPFSISMQSPNQQCQVPKEAAIVDSATQQLLEQNKQLLHQIAANIDTLKTEENAGLFLQTNYNIRTILTRMSETPGIMGHMPPLPAFVHEDKLNSLLQVDRLVQSYGAARAAHMKQEPRS